MVTKLFFDTEFTGLHQKTTLISIGIVSEFGDTFYAELTDYDKSQVDGWLKENVIDNLRFNERPDFYKIAQISGSKGYSFELKGTKEDLRKHLSDWLSNFDKIQVWSDCLSYDWVLFCDIFGHAFSVPSNVYYIPFDICPLLLEKVGDADISRENYAFDGNVPSDAVKHNALWDAEVIKLCYEKLSKAV